jgi:Ankyrin repeats (3 copies)
MTATSDRATTMTDVGVVLVSATAVFTLRVVCEGTLVAWVRGAPWGGFSPLHSVVDFIGLLCLLLTLIWAFVVATLALVDRSRLSATEWTLMVALIACCGLRAVPGEDWQLLVARVQGAGQVPRRLVVSAAASGEIRFLDYLLAHGVDVNTRTQYGESLLGAAAAAGQLDAARMLIARGARLDNRTDITLETPLTESAQMNHTEMVKLLLDYGANPGATDVLDRTALDWAHENGNYRMASLLAARTGE